MTSFYEENIKLQKEIKPKIKKWRKSHKNYMPLKHHFYSIKIVKVKLQNIFFTWVEIPLFLPSQQAVETHVLSASWR